ncbi:hypothetical protein HQ393_08675 [Chitinibacter bivalviorum]|uniref:EF-hand domain-containing protein n=1 Tax=Chitinibacter bivalviorum TaxID=2739434 RepID=A0A7H9BI71_9NEIS|nr:EF-hand domain-containing protein [Chitinibacter bivalviorum]QLG88315.1 hypothetical protein HQ393_08675 [Chitinibacter bivalviorum]
MRHSIKALCIAGLLSAASLAMAAPGNGPGPEGMPKGDVTRAEFMKHMDERFNMMDTNKDGVISEAERKAAHEKMREMRDQRRGERASMPRPCAK